MKKGKVIFLVFGKVTLIAFFIVLCLLVPITASLTNSEGLLYKKFLGDNSLFKGIITLWNVDTFEGGSASKASYLNSVCMAFEKEHKGTFIKVENLSLDEMNANIKNGTLPDIFSFGMGLGYVFKEQMQSLTPLNLNLPSEFYSAGLYGGNLLAVPWSYGAYTLISSTDRIEKASKGVEPLKDICFSLAYDKTSKKSTKHIYSLTYGKNDYVDAFNALSREFDLSVGDLIGSGTIDEKVSSQSPYEAYESFALNNSVCLLGTQRDVFRMENRIQNGKEIDALLDPLANFTDLVNFIGILDGDEEKVKASKEFIKFILSEKMQAKLASIGLFSPLNLKLYKEGYICTLEDAVINKIKIKNAF